MAKRKQRVRRPSAKKSTRRRPESAASRANRRARDPEAVEEDLAAKLRAAERATTERDFSASRDALAAMTCVRAIERALQLAEVEGGSRALRLALRAASKPLGAYVARHVVAEQRERRRKA